MGGALDRLPFYYFLICGDASAIFLQVPLRQTPVASMRWWCGGSTVSLGQSRTLLRALETFRALGVEFVSLSEQVDTSTPYGKLTFTVLGAVAELERSLIVERVKAGLRNARAKGKRLGRPRVSVSAAKIQELRAEGLTLRDIAARCRVSNDQRDSGFESIIAALYQSSDRRG